MVNLHLKIFKAYRRTVSQTLHGTAIYAYIGVVWGVNAGICGSPMECLGFVWPLPFNGWTPQHFACDLSSQEAVVEEEDATWHSMARSRSTAPNSRSMRRTTRRTRDQAVRPGPFCGATGELVASKIELS